MKKLLTRAWLAARLQDILPERMNVFSKKTPWYRRGWFANGAYPWIGLALMAPFGVFLIWKGAAGLLRGREVTSQ